MFTVFEYDAWYIDTMYVMFTFTNTTYVMFTFTNTTYVMFTFTNTTYVMFTFTNTTYVMFIIFLCAICYIYCFSNTIALCNVNT